MSEDKAFVDELAAAVFHWRARAQKAEAVVEAARYIVDYAHANSVSGTNTVLIADMGAMIEAVEAWEAQHGRRNMAVSEQDKQAAAKAYAVFDAYQKLEAFADAVAMKAAIAVVFAQARAEGYRQGVEDAAKVVAHTGYGVLTRKQWRAVADEIRALAETGGEE